MEFDKVIVRRKSVRAFKNKMVDWRLILEAVEAVTQGPFAGNKINVKFIIVEEPTVIKKIAEYSDQLWIAEAPALVVVCAITKWLEKLYNEKGKMYSHQQCGAAIETFLLKLVDVGLSGCWVGSFADHHIKTTLGIPEDVNIEAIIPIGYERIEKGRSKRPEKPKIENAISWELWDTSRRRPLFVEPKPLDIMTHGIKI